MELFDVAIIGAGVSGAAIARRLSIYDISVVLLERGADVSFGISKANSGIIHGGFHHNKKYLKAQLEIQGAGLYPQLHRELGFPYKRCGIVVAAFTPEEMTTAEYLYRQGVDNDSAGIELCGAERIRDLEPKLHDDVIGGLYAPAGGIIEPYRFVFSLVENAELNGVTVLRNFEVTETEPIGIEDDDGYRIKSKQGDKIEARYVINAAGLYADEVSRIFDAEEYYISPRKGEYLLLDRRTTACPSRVLFPVPTPISKGMLVIPTVEGTVLLGPTADVVHSKDDLDTTADHMAGILSSAKKLVPSISATDVITAFSGLRPTLESGDFYIEESKFIPNFIHVAGIQSPGLTAAPAVAENVKDILKRLGCRLTEKSSFIAQMPPVERSRVMDDEELLAHWSDDREEGAVVCRCETVTRAEIRRAIETGHRTLDGIKFYSRVASGRCQGAFCTPKVLEIISEETGLPVEEISKRGSGSELVLSTLPGTPSIVTKSVSSIKSTERKLPKKVESVVIGGGAAGMASAVEIKNLGLNALILDRETQLGGVLRQCIHNGFGIHEFGEELTGPEYTERWISQVTEAGVPVFGDCTVLGIEKKDGVYSVRVLSKDGGLERIETPSVVLAMGSRERNRGSIMIPGKRPVGVMTAGSAQRLINIEGYMPGKKAVIIGSGDIGLIMARRMKLIGCDVPAVIEIQPIPSGINRNIVQCLDDFQIPLYLGHVVTSIHGENRVNGVTVAPLENGVPQPSKAFDIACDTVLLSVGLVPENEISVELGVELHRMTHGPVVDSRLMTNLPGVFAAGNVLHIHDLVDFVAEEAKRAGRAVAKYLKGEKQVSDIPIHPGSNIRYVNPGRLFLEGENRLYMRSLISKAKANLELRADGELIKTMRMAHVQPSEMISLNLKAGELPKQISMVEVSLQ